MAARRATAKRGTAASLIKRRLVTMSRNDKAQACLIATEAGQAVVDGWRIEVADPEVVNDGKSASPPEQPPATGPRGKLGILVALLRHPDGATLPAMMAATGWQAHSVRGAMAGAIRKKLNLTIISEKPGTTRIWRIAGDRA